MQPFQKRDFLAYERHRQDDPEYNALRLAVRRKLVGIATEARRRAKELGTELASQAGLHHPYTFNNYRVSEQRAYLCRSNRERRQLATFFGDALGKDAETHYIQTILEVSVDAEVLQVALRIHPMAWWDGENLKKKVAAPAGMAEWCTMLKALPAGFVLKLHDWRKLYWAQVAGEQEMREYFGSYTPGEHWLHLQRELPQEDALAMGVEACNWAVTSLLALLPPYRFILWRP